MHSLEHGGCYSQEGDIHFFLPQPCLQKPLLHILHRMSPLLGLRRHGLGLNRRTCAAYGVRGLGAIP